MNNEKVYKTMSISGAANIAIGITILAIGVIAGVLTIITGASLLSRRKEITF